MCWTLSAPKHISSKHLLISGAETFKVWCIFNFLSEDKYPLHIVTEEVGSSAFIFISFSNYLISNGNNAVSLYCNSSSTSCADCLQQWVSVGTRTGLKTTECNSVQRKSIWMLGSWLSLLAWGISPRASSLRLSPWASMRSIRNL